MPVSSSEGKRILVLKIKKTLRDLRLLEKNTVKDVIGFLRRMRIEISETLKEVSRFEMPYYRAILREIDDKISSLNMRMRNSLTQSQRISFDLGANLSDDIFKTAGLTFGIPKLSDELIVTAQIFTTDLITDVSGEMRSDIARSLRKSILMGENNFDAARKIDTIIGINKKEGYMNRSDKIARTEIGRAFSIARQAKDEQVAEVVPKMKKQWLTAEDERVRAKDMGGGRGFISHREANGQIRNIDEPFDVGGEKLMFPRDPAGSPANIIGCRCQSIPYMEEWK